MDPYGFDDNASVGSLAVTDLESGRSVDDDEDDTDDDSDSPEGLVKKKSRAVGRIKFVLLVLMIGGGIFLSAAAYVTAQSEGGMKAGILGAFLLVQLLLFLRYDYLVSKRTSMLLDMAQSSRAIVDQLFPNFARDRLLSQQVVGSSHHSDNHEDDPAFVFKHNHHKGGGSNNHNAVDWEKLTKLNTLQNQRNVSSDAVNKAAVVSSKAPTQIRTFLSSGVSGHFMAAGDSEPIAELFPDTTVLFADIAGFTAWSSDREPSQVFRLLERVYGAFDAMAEKLKVFKVETIGDSYMCVTGLPEPDDQHAVNMSRFAYQCLVKMQQVTDELSGILGPGTEELDVRIGLHSGPVTAGVLRGQKSRFQLFGDTVNTASRMESTGIKGRIQVSESTAKKLKLAGKGHWIQERTDRIVAKGKGELRTFWLEPRRRTDAKDDGGEDHSHHLTADPSLREEEDNDQSYPGNMADKAAALRKKKLRIDDSKVPRNGEAVTLWNMNRRLKSSYRMLTEEKHTRLIDSNTDLILKYVVAVIDSRGPSSNSGTSSPTRSMRDVNHDAETHELPPPFESVADVILLPDYDPRKLAGNTRNKKRDANNDDEKEELDLDMLRGEIRSYVAEVAALYQDVPFHNFEHASHVTLAMHKLLSRMTSSRHHTELELHLLTYGISSDPITQLSMVFAALIHDVGHSGITNAQLVAEEAPVALKFKEKSVAEQNSVTVAWALLMHSRFKTLRSHLYKTNVERKRFRQVMINAVMATDIADRDVIIARTRKWKRAFQDEHDVDGMPGDENESSAHGVKTGAAFTRDERNRRATAVIDVLMQVADVAHTMQHWKIYRRWNEHLFQEMYSAYMNGRAAFDPTVIWFKGELAFMDHFVIPLARKVDECGVFGPSGDQYLTYALSNRNDWEQKGHEELKSMIDDARLIEPDVTVDVSRMDCDMESFAPSRIQGMGSERVHLVPTTSSGEELSAEDSYLSGASSTEFALETEDASSRYTGAASSYGMETMDADSDIDSITPVTEERHPSSDVPNHTVLPLLPPLSTPSKSSRTGGSGSDKSPSLSPIKPSRSPSVTSAVAEPSPASQSRRSPPNHVAAPTGSSRTSKRTDSPPPPPPGPPSTIVAPTIVTESKVKTVAPPPTAVVSTSSSANGRILGGSASSVAGGGAVGTKHQSPTTATPTPRDDAATFATDRVSL